QLTVDFQVSHDFLHLKCSSSLPVAPDRLIEREPILPQAGSTKSPFACEAGHRPPQSRRLMQPRRKLEAKPKTT
ncbi:MAG TPA: hypothetical protein VIJ17_01335, partial [Pseudolabrys sp.]